MNHSRRVLITCLLCSSCQVVGGYESFEAATGEATPAHPCDPLPASKPADGGLMVLTKQSRGSCFWIDQTEVTVAQYGEYLSQVESPLTWSGSDRESCDWKVAPSDPENSTDDACAQSAESEDLPFAPNKPIRCVDWCDAVSFCHWAGKTLCGDDPFALIMTSTTGEVLDWGDACSDGVAYPYGGTTYVSQACNIGMSQAECANVLRLSVCGPTTVPSAAPLQCTSPNGAADMVGNVAEWTADCDKDGEPMALECKTKGGSFADDWTVNCHTQAGTAKPRSTREPTIGIRCCAELSDEEKAMRSSP